jgi:hypothetical protein
MDSKPITVAARSKAWNVLDRSNAGIVSSNLTQCMDVCVHLLCVCVLCTGRGLAAGWSPVQGVLPAAYMIKKLKKRPRPNKNLYSHNNNNNNSNNNNNGRSRNSIVGITIGYRQDDRGDGVRVQVGAKNFSSLWCPDRLLGPPNLLSNGYRGLFLRG